MAKKATVKKAAGGARSEKKVEKKETIIGTPIGKAAVSCGCGLTRASKPCDEPKTDKEKSCLNPKCCIKCCNPVCIIALVAVIAVIAIFIINPFGDQERGEGAVLAAAIEASRTAMEAAESANSFVIDSDQYDIQSETDGYTVSFAILGSSAYSSFDIALDKGLQLTGVGLDGETMAPEAFLTSQGVGITIDLLQECAKRFNQNEQNGPIKSLVSSYYNGTSKQRFVMDMPKTLNCNGADYPYSLELGDGYVKTTLYNGTSGHYAKTSFSKGIVVGGVTIPAEALQEGVFLYVDRVNPGQLSYSYALKEKSIVKFDKYDPILMSVYNITSVPRLVWNCKYVLSKTLATAELNGSVPRGTEQTVIAALSCMYNNGYPRELCSSLGAVPDENGKINMTLPIEYYFSMYQIPSISCKPDNQTVKVQAFYAPGSTASQDQRPVLETVKEAFGDHMYLEYYCVGTASECNKYVKAND